VLGYVNRIKKQGSGKSENKQNPQAIKEYLILFKDQEKYVKEYEL